MVRRPSSGRRLASVYVWLHVDPTRWYLQKVGDQYTLADCGKALKILSARKLNKKNIDWRSDVLLQEEQEGLMDKKPIPPDRPPAVSFTPPTFPVILPLNSPFIVLQPSLFPLYLL